LIIYPTVSDCRDGVNDQDDSARMSRLFSVVKPVPLLCESRSGWQPVTIRKHDESRKTMTVYVIAQLKMTDRASYDRYQARFLEVFKKFSGRLLSADESPTVLEGTWDRDKLVLMSFPDETAFRAWVNSAEYLEISRDRKAGAQAVVLLVKGVG
jgi:uncharacterized protein (DUF1330 family)